jgi:ClpP class serine protease
MSKNIPHILEQVMHAPWLITPGGYQSILALIDAKLNKVYADEFNDDFEGPTIHWAVDSNGIATIPIKGVLGQRLSGIEKMCGGTDYLDLQQATQEAIDKKYAKGILYAFDSSGGMVRGCADLAAFIQNLPVPTAAFTDSRCNSAAYWLASACDEITSSGSADVGSIGVILPWIDKSKVWEVEGLKYEPFVNEGADLKGAGAGPSLTDAQRQHLQESVNFVGEKFQDFVNSNRKVKTEVFRAGSYFGDQALDVGLVDQVGTFGQAYQSLLTRVKNKNGDRAPVPTKIQVTKMTKEELKAQHPELYQALVQENETTAQNALEAARVQERNRLAELDALSFTPECKAIVDAAKAGNQTAPQIGVQIAQLLAKDNEHLRMQVGVYRGAKSTSAVANVDPSSAEEPQSEKALAGRLVAHFQKKFGSVNGRN